MNKRLVWNFEINNERPIDFPTLPFEEPEVLRWEARYFWEEDTRITLNGLNDKFLNLALFEAKERQDRYYLLPNYPYNVKQRRLELLYKPLMLEMNSSQGFGKKINLSEHPPLQMLPGTPEITTENLLNLINSQGLQIYVEKIALVYKIEIKPRIKLELARLKIADKIYFSVCIEGRSQKLVTLISNQILNQQNSCDYVHFLKKTLGLVKQ